jgi:hypothetical protein
MSLGGRERILQKGTRKFIEEQRTLKVFKPSKIAEESAQDSARDEKGVLEQPRYRKRNFY